MTPSSRFSEESHLCILRGVTRRDVLTATYELFFQYFLVSHLLAQRWMVALEGFRTAAQLSTQLFFVVSLVHNIWAETPLLELLILQHFCFRITRTVLMSMRMWYLFGLRLDMVNIL